MTTETLPAKLFERFTEEELKQRLRECSSLPQDCRVEKKKVLSIGEGIVAKRKDRNRLQKEYDIGTMLLHKGVHVPEMYGLMEVDGVSYPNAYLVMQEIRGKELRETRGQERERAMIQFRRELSKVLRLEVEPIDVLTRRNTPSGRNAIFGDDGKLYLIDFEHWNVGVPYKVLKPYFDAIERSIPQQV